MNKLLSILLLFLLAACSDAGQKSVKSEASSPKKKEVYKYYQITLEQDTINIVDFNDKKQGLWITYKPLNITEPITKLEEGYYKDDKKVGYWKYYKEGVVTDSVLMK